MAGLKWHFARLPNPDPARYSVDHHHSSAGPGGMSSAELDALRRKNAARVHRKVARKLAKVPRISLREALKRRGAQQISSISKRVAVVRASGRPDADEFIQQTALLVLAHAEKHGDCTAALDLVLALPAGARRNKLIGWFAMFGPIEIRADRGSVRQIDKHSSNYRKFDVARGTLCPFYASGPI